MTWLFHSEESDFFKSYLKACFVSEALLEVCWGPLVAPAPWLKTIEQNNKNKTMTNEEVIFCLFF